MDCQHQTAVADGRRRQRSMSLALLALCGSCLRENIPCHAFVVRTPPFANHESRRRGLSLFMTTSHVEEATTQHFSSMTVKQLRHLVKENGKRGIVSKLKRKQDLVDYLVHNNNMNQQDGDDDSGGADVTAPPIEDSRSFHRPKRRRNHPSLPPLDEASITPPLSPKDAIIEKVYQRYPPLRKEALEQQQQQQDEEGVDVRQLYHPIFSSSRRINNGDDEEEVEISPTATSCDMDVVFLGTASCTPGVTRGVSCTALRLNFQARLQGDGKTNNIYDGGALGTWLFDVGECTQLQVQRTASIRPTKITKIFLTHAHGDHTFGLVGLLCLMGQDKTRGGGGENLDDANSNREQRVIDIYGPQGLRMWLRVAIRYSCSRIVPPYRVHELQDVPMAPEWEFAERTRRFFYRGPPRQGQRQWSSQSVEHLARDPTSWVSQAPLMSLQPCDLYGEVPGGRDILPDWNHPLSHDGAPIWELFDSSQREASEVQVYAAPMSHGIPCVGYVVQESERPGRLRNEMVEPIVRRNVKALKEAGFSVPMKAMAVVKNLEPGSVFTFPDGTVVTQEEAVEPPRKGRKIVICGDTCDSRALTRLAYQADLLIHEATNSYLPGVDNVKLDPNVRQQQPLGKSLMQQATRDAIVHGHSTPHMAGRFCREVQAKRLVMNHFSARYKGDTSPDSMSIMMRIEHQAVRASGLGDCDVAASWDLMVLPIPRPE